MLGWKVLFAQLCLTLCNPMHCSPPGTSVHGILQARILVGCHFLLHPGCPSGQLNQNPWGWSLASVVFNTPQVTRGFPCGSAGEESACNVGDLGSIPGLGRSPGEGKGYPRHVHVHGVAKCWTRLSLSADSNVQPGLRTRA